MNVEQILLEDDEFKKIKIQSILLESKNSAKELFLQYYTDDNLFAELISKDPSPTFKYSRFIIYQYIQGNEVTKEQLEKFDFQSKRGKIKNKDIDSSYYKNYKNFLNALMEEEVVEKKLQDQIDTEREILYNENGIIIMDPKTHRCSRKYGSEKWCVAYESSLNWEQYSEYMGNQLFLFYVLDPNSKINDYKKVAIGFYNTTISSESEKQSYIDQLNSRIEMAKSPEGLTDPFGNVINIDPSSNIKGEDFIISFENKYYFLEVYDINNKMISSVDYIEYITNKGVPFTIFLSYLN